MKMTGRLFVFAIACAVCIIPMVEANCDISTCQAPVIETTTTTLNESGSNTSINSTANTALCSAYNTHVSCLTKQSKGCNFLIKAAFEIAITLYKGAIEVLPGCELSGAIMVSYSTLLWTSCFLGALMLTKLQT